MRVAGARKDLRMEARKRHTNIASRAASLAFSPMWLPYRQAVDDGGIIDAFSAH